MPLCWQSINMLQIFFFSEITLGFFFNLQYAICLSDLTNEHNPREDLPQNEPEVAL